MVSFPLTGATHRQSKKSSVQKPEEQEGVTDPAAHKLDAAFSSTDGDVRRKSDEMRLEPRQRDFCPVSSRTGLLPRW